ncbi:chaperonin 10-like protein [Dactylonectria macrodidyma]|uniref:Chaperonin 10-like protein n=1 Tax=Dactylonectria macrodidyma TaxID=307937 RepID=A0A9P9DFN9_9HYPO|nr:chaperonin 10-like protein [Dactylonectria macrodidyma]
MSSTTSMRAVVFKGVGKVAVEQRNVPIIQDPRDAIVKVSVAALCGSDLHWYRGHQKIPTGFIPGHEFAGVVHELGAQVTGLEVDDAVVATFTTQCGDCFYCKKRQTSRCEKSFLFGNSAGKTSIDGGQAEYVRVPFASSTLVPKPASLPDKMLVLMGDIFPTGYFCASRFLKPLPREEAKSTCIVVVGCGPVGICAIAAASQWCDNIFAVDMVPERLLEAQKLGAKPLLLTDDPTAKVLAATEGRGADVVLEVVGTPAAMQLCVDMVRPFGSISSVGVQTDTVSFYGPTLYAKNVTIAWGRCPVRGIFEEALECLIQVQDRIAFLCECHMKLEQAQEAYELFNDRKVHKVLLTL